MRSVAATLVDQPSSYTNYSPVILPDGVSQGERGVKAPLKKTEPKHEILEPETSV